MTENRQGPTDREQLLHEALLAYVEEAEAGRAPDRRRLLQAFPDLRTEIEEYFAGHDEVELLAAPLREATREDPDETLSLGGLKTPFHSEAGPEGELGQMGDFRLLREVGRGGMGVVYEAEQISLRRRVALKVLPFAAAIDPRQLMRFRNEAMAAAHLRHENVVPVHAVGSERGVHYYAMQFIEGQSLASLIGQLRTSTAGTSSASDVAAGAALVDTATRIADTDRLQTASISQDRSSNRRRYFHWVAGLGRQAALALEHAHQMGIVHRDVKPANLLLDAKGQLWITDFGLAQFSADAGLTLTGEVLGTLRYASPEQVLAKRGLVDHKSDVYSLGATLYELLTLRPIFDGRDRHELLRQIADADPLPPRSVDPSIPVELETIIMKAVDKTPSERYATAQELADDLQRYGEDRPIHARRPSIFEKAVKWSRRHRTIVASAMAVLVLSVAGLSLSTALIAQAYDRERQKASEAAEQRTLAEENFRQAWRAVDQLAQIGEDELAGDPRLERVRRLLLESALSYYQDFIDQHRDQPSIQKELEASRAKVLTLLGELTSLMGAGKYRLLQEPSVQKVLRLTDEQVKTLGSIHARWHDAFHEGRGQAPGEWQRRLGTIARDQEAEVARILAPEQLRRFQQIAIQDRGFMAFLDTDVASALALTVDQKKRFRELQEEFWPGPGGFGPPGGPPKFGPPGGERRGPPERSAETMRRVQEKMIGLLTVEQMKKWNEMIGPPFDGPIRLGPPPGPFGPKR